MVVAYPSKKTLREKTHEELVELCHGLYKSNRSLGNKILDAGDQLDKAVEKIKKAEKYLVLS